MRKNFRLTIVLLIATIIVFTLYNIDQIERQISEKQYDNLVNDLSMVASDFGIWINNKKDILKTSSDILDNFAYEDITQDNTANLFLNINNADPDVSQLYIGLVDGRFVTGGQWVPPSDYDPRTRVWYREAVTADTIIVSKVYIDRETGSQLVTISMPLYLDDGFAGVLSADVFLNNIKGYLKNKLENDNSFSYLLDNDGLIITHTSKDALVGKNLYTDIQDTNLLKYFERIKLSSEPIRVEYNDNDKIVRGIIQKVKGVNWYLAVATSYDSKLSDFEHINSNTLIINGISILIIMAFIYMISNMKSEIDDLNELLKYDNERDFLTEIYNRKYLNLYMEKLWMSGDKTRTVSVLLMDIDKFKQYNDTYGHLYGDEILKAVTECISDHTRKEDVLARFGGEEFSLILKDVPNDEAVRIGEKIRDAVYDLNLEHKSSSYGRITISIGVSTVKPSDGISVREAINRADNSLYQAKDAGRNAVISI